MANLEKLAVILVGQDITDTRTNIMLKHLDLCSGIGGFAVGFSMAKLSEPIAFCDTDKFCQKVLAKNFPGIPIYDDVKEIADDPTRFISERPDVLTSGYPCQPFSTSGKSGGSQDPRHIFPYLHKLIEQIRPTYCVFENVYGHISLGLDEVLFAMESINYHTRTFVLPSSAIGARHKRERLWIICRNLGDPDNYGFPTTEKCRGDQEDARGTQKRSQKTKQLEGASRSEDNGDVSDPYDQGFWTRLGGTDNDLSKESGERRTHGSRSTSHDERSNLKTTTNGRVEVSNTKLGTEETQLQRKQSVLREETEGRQTDRSSSQDLSDRGRCKTQLRLDGVANGVSYWLDEPRGVPRIIVDQKDRANRLKALGNAIVPQNAMLIGLAIKKELTSK